FYKRSLLSNPLNDDALKNMGEDYLKLGKLDSAEFYLLQSLSLRRKRKAATDVGKVLNQLGEFYRKQGKTQDAFNTLVEARDILNDANEIKAMKENVLFRKRLATDNRNFKLALVLADSLYFLEQSVFEEERLKVTRTQALYDLKAEQERALKLEQQNKIITLEKGRQRISLYFTVSVAFLTVIIASLLWFAYKTSRKRNTLLLKHNKLKDAQKAEISHRNKNGYNRIVVLLRSLKKNLSDPTVEKDMERIERMVFGLANLESFLYIHQSMDDEVYVSDFIDELIVELQDSFSLPGQNIRFQQSISRIVLPAEQLTIVALLITELTINAFKHAFPEGEGLISVNLSTKDKEVTLEFKDDGIGLNHQFQANQDGFYILESLLKQTNGTYSYDSTPNEGTRFTFTFLLDTTKPENALA
ncbi:MAG: ATP-binding protein, partial [Bacteroidota bacterium]